ncbi:MAG: hypothetical protein KGO94_02005 [Alphaproteobacteria bacterium]|nr:hypothetical protein [Alphaproteobacteria bacterium]
MKDSKNKDNIIDIDPASVVDNEPPPVPEGTIPKPMSRKFGVIGLATLAVLTSALAGGWIYRSSLSSYLPSDQMLALSARVDGLETAAKTSGKKIDAVVGFSDEFKSQLNAAVAQAAEAKMQAAANATEIAAAKSKLQTLEKGITDASSALRDVRAQLAASPAGTTSPEQLGLAARLDKIEKDLASLHSAATDSRPSAASLSQAMAELSAKVASGAPFEAEISQLARLIPSAEGLDILQSNAVYGAATSQQLIETLQSAANDLSTPHQQAATIDNSWWGYAGSLMSNLVTVRTAGTPDWAALAQRCVASLKNGKLTDAVALLNQNLEALPKPLQEWRLMAAKSLATAQALDKVKGAVARDVAARG